LGWPRTYELLAGLEAPANEADSVAVSAAAWTISILGWLIVPALVGGVAGYVVTAEVSAFRSLSLDDVRNLAGRGDEAS